MTIEMEEGFELTQEIKDMARGYDAYYRYIDNYGQMKDAEYENERIMKTLRPLGVKRITQ
jgi:hypothetical protein